MRADALHVSCEMLHRELLPRVQRLRRYVQRKIPHRLRASVSADDILQETWVAAYRTVSTFVPDGPDAVDRWLTTIANSRIVDVVRAARRRKRDGLRRRICDASGRLSSLGELFARIQSPQKTPSSEFRAIERAHAVSMALNQLKEDRRRAVYMHYIEGCSQKEIAARIEKTEAAVNSLLYHGLLEMRSVLGDAAKYFSDVDSSKTNAASGTDTC